MTLRHSFVNQEEEGNIVISQGKSEQRERQKENNWGMGNKLELIASRRPGFGYIFGGVIRL